MSEEESYSVYIHRNTLNNKVYVGITKQRPEDRWRQGRGYKNNLYFWRAIQKHGWDSFEHIIVSNNLSKEDAENMEINLILHYKSNDKKYGYNIQNGGMSIGKHSEESKLKIRIAASNISDKTREKMRIAQKTRLSKSEENPMYGKHHTEEARRKISEARCGIRLSDETRRKMSISRGRIVAQYTLDNQLVRIYNSTVEAQKFTGVSSSNISSCCTGRYKTAGGYLWRYLDEKCG